MAIIPTPLPFVFINGTTADATQVNSDLNTIVNNVNTNAAHSGANSDITSLTALSTPLSAGQGGTGAATLTAHGVLVGEGTGPVVVTAPGTAGQVLTSNGAAADPTFSDNPIRGFLGGLILSTAGGSTTFACSAGSAADSTGVTGMTLGSVFTKTQAAWAVGSGNGSLDTGVVAVNTWYHVFLIKRPDTGVVDLLISLSPTAPTLPTNYTLFRRIGAMRTDNPSHNWTAFTQVGSQFLWVVPVNTVSAGGLNTTPVLVALFVPTGVKVRASFRALITNSAVGMNVLINSPDEVSAIPNAVGGNMNAVVNAAATFFTVDLTIRTDTSAQIRGVSSAAANGSWFVATYGWYDDDRQFGQ